MIDLSCDIRTMEYSIEFVIFDLRTESTPEDL